MEPNKRTFTVNMNDAEDVVDHIIALAKPLKGSLQALREDLKMTRKSIGK